MDIQSITFPGLDEIYGVAPSGYGLGKSTNQMQRISTPEQADQLLKAGWYEYYNVDVPCCELGTKYGAILVIPTMWSTTQFFFCRGYYGSYLKRILNDSDHTWEPWEWVNPPMIVGVEYRTTERFEGYPVYTKVINCGKVTPGGTTSISLNGDLGRMVLRNEAHNKWLSMPYYIGNDAFKLVAKAVTPTEIEIEAGTSHTNTSVCVRAWYLK